MRLCVNSKAMQVKVQREKESSNGTMKENHNTVFDDVVLATSNLQSHVKFKVEL